MARPDRMGNTSSGKQIRGGALLSDKLQMGLMLKELCWGMAIRDIQKLHTGDGNSADRSKTTPVLIAEMHIFCVEELPNTECTDSGLKELRDFYVFSHCFSHLRMVNVLAISVPVCQKNKSTGCYKKTLLCTEFKHKRSQPPQCSHSH